MTAGAKECLTTHGISCTNVSDPYYSNNYERTFLKYTKGCVKLKESLQEEMNKESGRESLQEVALR